MPRGWMAIPKLKSAYIPTASELSRDGFPTITPEHISVPSRFATSALHPVRVQHVVNNQLFVLSWFG